MIELLPAIDIMDARCVRLTKGDYAQKKVYDGSPLDVAMSYCDCGVKRVHLVDLDGARQASPANLKTLEAIANKLSCEIEWGGGIKSGQALRDVFSAGATKAIVGSVAALKPESFEQWLDTFGDRMILGADVKDGMIAVNGWQQTTQLSIAELVKRFNTHGLDEVIVTDIGRDGMLQGPSDELYVKLQSEFPQNSFTVSGGISSMDDIERLDALGLKKVIIGKAIYENRITLKDIEKWSQNA